MKLFIAAAALTFALVTATATQSLDAPSGFDNKTNGMVDDATHQADQTKFDEVEQLSDGLGERGNDFDYIDGLLFAAQRAVLCIEVVDRLADQTVHARPLIIRFRGIRHDQSLSLEALLDLCAGLVSMRPSALRMASVFSRVLRSDGFS